MEVSTPEQTVKKTPHRFRAVTSNVIDKIKGPLGKKEWEMKITPKVPIVREEPEEVGEEFIDKIGLSAKDRLTKSSRGLAYTARVQGGVEIAENYELRFSLETQARITSLLGIAQLTTELRHSLFDQAAQGLMTDSSKYSPEKSVITNQARFAEDLLGSNPRILDRLAEIVAKAEIFIEASSQGQSSAELEDLRMKVTAWRQTVDEVARILCGNDTEKSFYQKLIAEKITMLNNPTVRTSKGNNGQVTSTTRQSYRERLNALVQKPRARELISSNLKPQKGGVLADKIMDEYLETAFTLNAVRVLDRIQRPLGFESGKFRKLISCLEGRETDPHYVQLIEVNNLTEGFNKIGDEIAQIRQSVLTDDEKKQKIQELNDQFKERCRLLIEGSFNQEPDTDESIDLIATKQNIVGIQQRAQEIRSADVDQTEKRKQLSLLDQEMQMLFVAIANKVDRVFPHQSSTDLAEVLENEEAVCAGKVNVLLAISKFLGINARANQVKEIFNHDTTKHVCLELDLSSGNKLVIDANVENGHELDGKTDEEHLESIQSNDLGITDPEVDGGLRNNKLIIANSRGVPPESRVLIYTTENTLTAVTSDEQLQATRENPNLFVRINPYSGKREVWRASVPYPHLITAPDKDGYFFINSSFTHNIGSSITRYYQDIGIYLFRKHIEMNPYDALGYIELARMLPEAEGTAFLEQVIKDKPSIYWDRKSLDVALSRYAHDSGLDKTIAYFEAIKGKDAQRYYEKIHELSQLRRKRADLVGLLMSMKDMPERYR